MDRLRLGLLALFSVVLSGVVAAPSGAAENAPGSGFGDFSFTSTKDPIEVTAKQLDFDYKQQTAIFRGDDEVVQGDIQLDSDRLTVRYSEKKGRQEVEAVQADGHVRIRQGVRTATGERAIFDQASRTLILTGNAQLQDGPNQLSGDTVVVYPDQSKMEVKGENRRVKVLLFPERTPGGGSPAPTEGATPAP